eukprot:3503978-Prymnesium_polylepis.2
MNSVGVAYEVTEDVLEVLDWSAALVEILKQMRRMAGPAGEVRLISLHLRAHLHRLIRGVVVRRRQRRSLAPRAVRLRLAVLVPFVLEVSVDVARLGRGDEQAILIDNEVGPRGVGCGIASVEDEQPRQHTEVIAIPEARWQFRVPRHLTEAAQLRRNVGGQCSVASACAPELLAHLGQRVGAASLFGGLLSKVPLEAAEERDLRAALAFRLPLCLAAHRHHPLPLEHLVEVELHLVRVAQLADRALPRAYAGKKHTPARLGELLRRNLLDLDAELTLNATLRVDVPLSHIGRHRRACTISCSSRRRPPAYLRFAHGAAAQRHLYHERHAVVLLSLSEDLQEGPGRGLSADICRGGGQALLADLTRSAQL